MNDDRDDRRRNRRFGQSGAGEPAWPTADDAAGARPRPPRQPGPSRRDPAEAETRPVPRPPEDRFPADLREPDLLTHREPLLAGSAEDPPGDAPDEFVPEDDRDARRRKIWRRVRRTAYVAVGLGIFLPILGFVILYQIVSVPDPVALMNQLNQPITVYYADGSVMYSRSSGQNSHQLVTWNEIPQVMKEAQMAAEDETFMTNSGFDLKAILRTVVNRLTGGVGGGSTIGQEYVKKATGNDQATLSRKVVEMVQSYKMTNTYSKQAILTAYLNTVYFGRGAYGIKAAAQAFFGEDISRLTVEQASLLAGLVQLPSSANDVAYEHKRYSYVMGRMLANHWITQRDYDTAKFPTPIPDTGNSSGSALSPTRQYIVHAVFDELADKGYSEQDLARAGAKIYTTISPPAQAAAEAAVGKVMSADANYPDEAAALVSVDPRSGAILAYYGGDGSTSYDLAKTPQQPGSSFKPYVFASALQNGTQDDGRPIGLDSIYDGSDNQTIDGQLVHNSDGEGNSRMSVKDAMTQSVNTVFYRMGAQVGVTNVRNTAWDAGIPKQITSSLGSTFDSLQQDDPGTGKGTGETQLGISIGQYPVRPIDQAQGYATFADGGMYLPVHLVSKFTDNNGDVRYQFNVAPKPAFSPDPNTNSRIAATVTQSMTDVASYSRDGLADGRPNAAKTGTAQYQNTGHNSEAWMVGYTPQVVTAVWFGNKKQPAPIYGNYHNGIGRSHGYDVYGREEPGYIWQAYMNAYLANQPVMDFPSIPALGDSTPTANPTTATQPQNPVQPTHPVTTTTTSPPTTTTPPKTTTSVVPTTTCGVLGCNGGGPIGHGGGPGGGPPGGGSGGL